MQDGKEKESTSLVYSNEELGVEVRDMEDFYAIYFNGKFVGCDENLDQAIGYGCGYAIGFEVGQIYRD